MIGKTSPNRIKKILLLALTSSLGLYQTAQAEAPTIGGNVNIAVETQEVTNAAEGDNTNSQVIVGSFTGTNSNGDVDIVVSTGAISNIASGSGSCNQVVIGSVVGSGGCLANTPPAALP